MPKYRVMFRSGRQITVAGDKINIGTVSIGIQKDSGYAAVITVAELEAIFDEAGGSLLT